MTEFEIVLSERYGLADAEEISTHLRRYIPLSRPLFRIRKSIAEFPQVIQLIADPLLWKAAFGIAAASYLGRVGYRLADLTIDKVLSLFKANEVQALAGTANALSDATKKIDKNVTLELGVKLPHRRALAILEFGENEPAKVAYVIATLVMKIDAIVAVLQRESAMGHTPADDIMIELLEDNSLELTWQYWQTGEKLATQKIQIQ